MIDTAEAVPDKLPHIFSPLWHSQPISCALAWQQESPEGICLSDIPGVVLATRFNTVKMVLHEEQRFSAIGQKYLGMLQAQAHYSTVKLPPIHIPKHSEQRFLAHMDGAALRKTRRILRTPFTAANSKNAIERCTNVIDQSVELLEHSSQLDLVGWCDDLAVRLISVLIGYEGDIIELSRWCRKRGAVPSSPEGKLAAPNAQKLFVEQHMGAEGFYGQYRKDGLGHQAAAEIVGMLASITHESLQWAMTNAFTVFTHHHLWEAINAQNTVSFIDEALRLYTPTAALARLAVEDTEVGGVKISAGNLIICLLHAAQHDTHMFAHPSEFILSRKHVSEVTFGMGPHACLGFPIARPLLGNIAHRIAQSSIHMQIVGESVPLPEMINSTWIKMPISVTNKELLGV